MSRLTITDSSGPRRGRKNISIFLRWIVTYGCFLAAPLLARIAVLDSRHADWLRSDFAGFASDFAVSLIMTFLFCLVASRYKLLSVVLIPLWSIFHIANFEHISANGDLLSLAYIGNLFNPTFFFGSAIAFSNKSLTVAIAVIPFGALFVRQRRPSVFAIPAAVAAVVLFFAIGSSFANFLDPRWRRYNVVHANAEDLYFSIAGKSHSARRDAARALADSLRKKDLSGTPFVPRGERSHNVLLVLLEGACGGMLPSVAAYQHLHSDISMSRLDSIARRRLLYANFITHQRQTNRGEFSILSGTLPKLNSSTPKMTEYVSIGRLGKPEKNKFLPAYLASHGFETTYLQAAPMAFMLKDAFMPRIGFGSSYGTSWFKRSYASGYWGIDDKAFFEQAFELIRSKKDMKRPWFVTLLTVGTHHPTTLPSSYGDADKEDDRVRAYRYLDEAICGFIDSLSGSGFLDNTLVIITCDESQGVSSKADVPAALRLSQQCGLCVVLHPRARRAGLVEGRFVSSDIALSVLDYLGLSADSTSFGGRSMFRNYPTERDVFFANTYGNVIGRFTSDGFLDLCTENLRYGERQSIEAGRLFSCGKRRVGSLDAETISEIATFALASNASVIDPLVRDRSFDFYTGVTHSVKPGGQYNLLVGQYFKIPKDCFVSVRYRGRVLPGDSCVVFLKHDLASNSGKMRIVEYMHGEALPGNDFSAQYEFYSNEGYAYTEFRATAEVIKGEKPARIVIDEARLAYTRRPPTPEERKQYCKAFNKNVGRMLGAKLVIKPTMVAKVGNKNALSRRSY